MAELDYKNGKEHGKVLSWRNDGTIHMEINYLNGMLHGRYIRWDFNNNIIWEKHFKKGKLVKTIKQLY